MESTITETERPKVGEVERVNEFQKDTEVADNDASPHLTHPPLPCLLPLSITSKEYHAELIATTLTPAVIYSKLQSHRRNFSRES